VNAATDVAFDSDALYGIMVETWTAYLGMEQGEPLARIENPGPLNVVASVSITGAWDGHVIVSTSEAASVAIAAAMLDLDADAVSEADILDAAGELVNVVGGNVKNVMPAPTHLSLPMTTQAGLRLRYPGTRELCGLTADWRGEPVTVTVRQVDLS
jgi:chemotaxis protein CheX